MRAVNRGTWLLCAGAAAGVALAATGVTERRTASASVVPVDAVAVVNGEAIRRVDYQRALAAFASDRRDGRLDDGQRQRVLDRLIDEELLVQRGLELRLAARDPMVRRNLSAAVIALFVSRAEEETADPSEKELGAFYTENIHYFRHPDRVRAEQAYFRATGPGGSEGARARTRAAHERLAQGASFESVRESGDAPTAPLPNALLPPAKLREYLGPTAARALERLAPGETSQPIATASGHRILRVLERELGGTRSFEEVRSLVRSEFRRHAGDRRVRRMLDERRAIAEIRIAEERL